jgi:N-acyl-D-amino-acid deacylase
MHDLVIRGGTLVDGTGGKRFTADIGIDGGIISDVGRVGAGKREIDADGLLVTPGFVDIHTHYDGQVTWDEQLSPSCFHGVTSVMMGNCGVGFAPVKADKHNWLIGLMEGVEDIPGAALHEGIQWGWESFEEYLDAIDGLERKVDFATQIPHGALRGYVMGERGAANEDATSDDIEAMYNSVRRALEAGALGFSSSRTSLHKAISGRPVPGTFAASDELFGIARALKDTGKGVFQVACQHENVPAELEWMTELSKTTGRTVMFNLSQTYQDPTLWQKGLRGLTEAQAQGAKVYAQVAGRAIGVVMGWRLTANPFSLKPSYLQIMHWPHEKKLARLQDPEFRRKLINEPSMNVGDFERFVTSSFEHMYPMSSGRDYEPGHELSVAAEAVRKGVPPEEIAYDHLMDADANGSLYFPLFNYADNDLELLRELHQHPLTRMGLSDAGAHCGAVCDGGMPTFMLTHWTRDRSRGEKLDLEHVVRRQTSETAQTIGLFDRGVIAPGYMADLNVIDYENLAIGRPEVVYDLPANGRRLLQGASGYRYTIKRGEITIENDKATDALPGRLIRGMQRRKP